MISFVIGVDGGGSKTEAVILNELSQEMGRGRAGSSNLLLMGKENTRLALLTAMQAAADAAGVRLEDASAVVWALAGAGRPAQVRILQTIQQSLLPHAPGYVCTDALGALVGGIGARAGVVVISGTGMMVYGENNDGETARAGGWGHLLDSGSGYAIGQSALQAITKTIDGSEQPTILLPRILAQLQLASPQDIISWIYSSRPAASEIAALAPLVLEVATTNDLLATEILLNAAEALAASVETVARKLGLSQTKQFPLVFSGGLLLNNAFYRSVASQTIRTRVPAARPQLPHFDAATGAGFLALELVGHKLWPFDIHVQQAANVWASEQRNELTRNFDQLDTFKLVSLMHLEDKRAVSAVRPNLPTIAAAIDAIAQRMQQGGRLIYVGAGTSGRLGVLDASECPPTFNTSPDLVVGVIAGGNRALTESIEEAEDDPAKGSQAMAELTVGPLDSVVGIAASGRTPYVIGALAEARSRGALTATITCNLPAPTTDVADFVLAPLVGPEVITGSTRLKAGTVQKLILNMLSTGVMVRMGKTYGNLMVDVRQQNAKLQKRARRIVAQACNIDETEAAAALAESVNDVKVAIVSTLRACSPEAARRRLKRVGGDVRAAVSEA